MSAPAYADLGKLARDVFSTSYNFDFGKVHLTSPLRDVLVDAEAKYGFKQEQLTCSILGKYSLGSKSAISAKYASNGLLVAEYLLNGNIGSDAENVGMNLGYTYNTNEDFQSVKVGGKFHNETLHATTSLTKDFDRNVDLLGSVVVRIKNFFVGYQAGYDTTTSKLTKNDCALAVQEGSVGIHFRCIQIPREFGLSLYHRVNESLEVAMDAKTANASENRLWFMGVGMAYRLNHQWKWRVKIDKNVQLASSMQIALKENVYLTLSMCLDLLQPSNGQHKVGFGLCVS